MCMGHNTRKTRRVVTHVEVLPSTFQSRPEGWGWQEGDRGCGRNTGEAMEQAERGLGCPVAKGAGEDGGGTWDESLPSPRVLGRDCETSGTGHPCQQVSVALGRGKRGNSSPASGMRTWAAGGNVGKHLRSGLPHCLPVPGSHPAPPQLWALADPQRPVPAFSLGLGAHRGLMQEHYIN